MPYQHNDMLVINGRFKSQLAASGQIANALNVHRILVSTAGGTPSVALYDATSATGEPVWQKTTTATGDIYELQCPDFTVGVYVALGTGTKVTVVYT